MNIQTKVTREPKKLLTVKEAAAFCGVHVQTLYNYKSLRKGPTVNYWFHGRRRRIGYFEKDLRDWLEKKPVRKSVRVSVTTRPATNRTKAKT